MRVLKLTFGKIFYAKFSLSFCLISLTRTDGCGSDGRTVMLHIRTRVALTARHTSGRERPVACSCGNARPDGLMSRPNGDPTGFKNPSHRIFQLPHSISLLLLVFSAWFLEIFALSRLILSSCAYIYSLQVYFLPFVFLLVLCYLLEFFIFGEFFF